MIWIMCHAQAHPDHLGFIPEFFDPEDERTAAEQVQANYGGWYATDGFQLGGAAELNKPHTLKLYSHGDPPLVPLWCGLFRDKMIIVYEYGYTAIFDPDLGFEVSRLD
jgi:hypothetical protein